MRGVDREGIKCLQVHKLLGIHKCKEKIVWVVVESTGPKNKKEM